MADATEPFGLLRHGEDWLWILQPLMPIRFVFSLLLVAPPVWLTAAETRAGRPGPALLTPAEQQPLFHVPPGFSVQLVASEPEIQKPLNLNFDAAGRLWVTGTEMYPWPGRTDARGEPIASFEANWNDNPVAFRAASTPPVPEAKGRDTVRVLSDFGPDGRARRIEVFADGLNIPIGVQPLPRRPGARGDTVIVHSIPAIWKLEDTDGDGRADRRERLYGEFGFKDTHGMASSFTYWMDGWVYGTHGFLNRSEVRDGAGNVTVLESGNTYRFRPDGSRFEVWTRGQTNPFGLALDARGDVYTADSHSKPVYLLVRGGYYEGISKQHDGLGFAPAITTDNHGSTAIAGIAAYAANYFPEEYRDNLFNGNPITRRINRVRLEWTGSTPKAVRLGDFLTCDDPSFRPVQVKLGPDGALWIADFYNPIIGHYETPLTHPDRDRAHGRIWRVVWHGEDYSVRPPPQVPDLATVDATTLVSALGDSNLVVRALAANELVDRIGGDEARAALLRGGALKGSLAVASVRARLGLANENEWTTKPGTPEECLTALRWLGERGGLGAAERAWIEQVVTLIEPGHVWRAMADVFARHPETWQAPLILTMQTRAPEGDTELVYALRLALKAQVMRASANDLNGWVTSVPGAEARLADVALAVPSPVAAEFLLGYLERTAFADPRAGDFARHAVLQLPLDRLSAVETMIRSLETASSAQKLVLAEGLVSALSQPGRVLPESARGWMGRTLLALLDGQDLVLARRAAEALRELDLPVKTAPLARIAAQPDGDYSLRLVAIRGLPAKDPVAAATLVAVAGRTTDSINLRKQAVTQMGLASGDPVARIQLVALFPGAPVDLALSIATALARSEAGARELVGAVSVGKAPASLLRHRNLENAFATFPAELRAKAAGLTAGLPPEDARLDVVIAQRSSAFVPAKADASRGSEVFAQNCVMCHRRGSVGGNIGPSLDGIGSRGAGRLLEDILDPSRNVDPAFRLASVALRSGETRSGMNLRDEGTTYRLTDPISGKDEIVLKSEVTGKTLVSGSPMPAAFESSLSEKDFFDLLAYLLRPST